MSTPKLLFFIIVLNFLFLEAFAITRGNLTGSTGMINIVSKDMTGSYDTDAQVLFESMNVPEQDSAIFGPGKVIKQADNSLNFICANRPNEGHRCSIFINKSRNSSLRKDRILYRLTGAEADLISNQLHLDGNKKFYFESVESNLAISAKPGDFYIFWKEDGVR